MKEKIVFDLNQLINKTFDDFFILFFAEDKCRALSYTLLPTFQHDHYFYQIKYKPCVNLTVKNHYYRKTYL